MSVQSYGRHKLITYEKEINASNVISVLSEVMPMHINNASRIDFLLKYEAGEQPIKREKIYRKDIDCKCVDNVANEITDFKRGFQWGNPITLIRADGANTETTEAISKLNKQFAMDGSKKKTQELGRFIEIAGIGIEYIDINDEYREGKSYFKTVALDPRTSFVVYSGYYIDRRPMMGVTFRKDAKGNVYFTCITKDYRFEIENLSRIVGRNHDISDRRWDSKSENWKSMARNNEKNPFGLINIIEWEKDSDRMGCFERQISDMDALNLLESDFLNDVEQNTNAVWHGNDIDFEEDEEGNPIKPASGDWINTFTSPDGKQPFIRPLTIEYEYDGMLHNILSKRALILQKANVPQRNDNSGGSTGIAMSDATGWSAAEMAASKQQPYQEDGKMREVEVVLEVLKYSSCPAGDELRKLNISDVAPNIKRTKSYEMTTKVNAFATLVNHGCHGEDALRVITLFDDPNDVWEKSRPMIEKLQQKLCEKETRESRKDQRLLSDNSDQIENSPVIDGMRTSRNETQDSQEVQ